MTTPPGTAADRVRTAAILLAAFLGVGVIASPALAEGPCPADARQAVSSDPESRTQEKPRPDVRAGRFQLELYNGISSLTPGDLNLMVDYDLRLQKLFYDEQLDYLQAQGRIKSWSFKQRRGRKKLRQGLPVGLRIKYFLNPTWALSAGFKYIYAKRSADADFEYARIDSQDIQDIETMLFSPYSLSVHAFAPSLGVHFILDLDKTRVLEAYLAGGPLFAQCRYLSNWAYSWHQLEGTQPFLVFYEEGRLEQKGTGSGLALEFGARLYSRLSRRLQLFIEGGAAFQRIGSVSGPGLEVRNDVRTEWNDRWAVKSESIETAWADADLEFPTNYWPEDLTAERIRDFKLDLSGLHLRWGLVMRF